MKSPMENLTAFVVAVAIVASNKFLHVRSLFYIPESVFCSDVVTTSGEPSFEVCSWASYTAPSPVSFENDTTIYEGRYSATYQITKGLSEGAEIPFDSPAELAGIGISVGRDNFDKCTVSVQYALTSEMVTCNSCKYCGDESYAADCSNVRHGRSFDVCESTAEGIVFFPLTYDALNKTDVQQQTNNATTTNSTILTTGSGAPPKKKGGKKRGNGKNGGRPPKGAVMKRIKKPNMK